MGKTVGKMKLGPMALAVLKLVRERPGTSWVELCRYIHGAIGERPVMAAPNVVLWWGVSDELIDTLNELRNAGLLELWNCSLLLYAADGQVPMLPVAAAERLDSYRTPHWLPSVFQLPRAEHP